MFKKQILFCLILFIFSPFSYANNVKEECPTIDEIKAGKLMRGYRCILTVKSWHRMRMFHCLQKMSIILKWPAGIHLTWKRGTVFITADMG